MIDVFVSLQMLSCRCELGINYLVGLSTGSQGALISLSPDHQGLSAECLKGLCAGCGLQVPGNCSNKLRVTKLLEYFCYGEEMIEKILALFKKDKEETVDTEENPELDSTCEAELLTKILDAAEKSKAEKTPEKTDGPPAKKMKCHHAEKSTEEEKHGSGLNLESEPFAQLETKPDLANLSVPKGCTLRVYQGAGSPYVRGVLPEGHKWKGKFSHNRSFDPSGGTSSSSSVPVGSSRQSGGRAVLSEAAAKAAVLAWLWDWAKAQGVSE